MLSRLPSLSAAAPLPDQLSSLYPPPPQKQLPGRGCEERILGPLTTDRHRTSSALTHGYVVTQARRDQTQFQGRYQYIKHIENSVCVSHDLDRFICHLLDVLHSAYHHIPEIREQQTYELRML